MAQTVPFKVKDAGDQHLVQALALGAGNPALCDRVRARRLTAKAGTTALGLSRELRTAAVFYTKLGNRLLRPLLAADQPQAPAQLRAAGRTIDQHITTYLHCARLACVP